MIYFSEKKCVRNKTIVFETYPTYPYKIYREILFSRRGTIVWDEALSSYRHMYRSPAGWIPELPPGNTLKIPRKDYCVYLSVFLKPLSAIPIFHSYAINMVIFDGEKICKLRCFLMNMEISFLYSNYLAFWMIKPIGCVNTKSWRVYLRDIIWNLICHIVFTLRSRQKERSCFILVIKLLLIKDSNFFMVTCYKENLKNLVIRVCLIENFLLRKNIGKISIATKYKIFMTKGFVNSTTNSLITYYVITYL